MNTNRELTAFLLSQTEKLDAKKINHETAKAQANLAKQVNNTMRYELDRVKAVMKIKEFNKLNVNDQVELRDAES
jgi:hypothetical protein